MNRLYQTIEPNDCTKRLYHHLANVFMFGSCAMVASLVRLPHVLYDHKANAGQEQA